MIQAAIFDMDGLLIDSEPLWKKAEIKIFGELGIHLTPKTCGETEGLRVDEVVSYWDKRYPNKIINKGKTINEIIQSVGALIEQEGEGLPGVEEAILFFKQKNIPMAIASASSYYLINIVVNKLNIKQHFQVIQSAENLEFGKPHPQVFIEAARKLGVSCDDCLVFEDSVFGVLAAKAARMKVVAVPYEHNFSNMEYVIANAKIASLSEFNLELYNNLNT